MTLFLDTNIFVYAFGDESVYREPCRQLLASVVCGDTPAVASTEVVQEVAQRYLKRGEAGKAVGAIDGVTARPGVSRRGVHDEATSSTGPAAP